MEFKDQSVVFDAPTRLIQLGLTVAKLNEAVRQAYLFRTRLTPNHPRIFFGYGMWAETVAALRDNLRPDGWFKSDDSNYELTINKDSTVAIAVTTGDENTGFAGFSPSNKCPKGPHTTDAIMANQQLDMFADLIPPADEESPMATWVLLTHVAADEVRSELSLPLSIVNGKITAWKERIILPAIPRDDDTVSIVPPDVPDIDVPIFRKQKV